ncbi:A/G-specific adenine glycosylase [Luteolibacter algae]|uniref:Adenine DNA glycosylase n=1 Tax=Luteolibacter algae TaxID=454151 RepID=A0ABW5D4H9_9BACT
MSFLKPRFERSALDAAPKFRNALGEWFDRVGKDFPWRRTSEPYPVLVSEMMLQQTQVATVLGKGFYTRFLEKFPDIESLAIADDQSLLKAWEGLGYYRRARMLRDTARAIAGKHGGTFPGDESTLLSLPGIGPYTASALRAFAFNQPSALVDGNVSRILARLMDDETPIDSTPGIRKHREWARTLCDPERPARHHHAMMELGQNICRPGVPHCEACPVSPWCKTVVPENLPLKKPRAKLTDISEYAVWLLDEERGILLHQENGSRRNGLWKLPLRSPAECASLELAYQSTYPITRYRVTLRVYHGNRSTDQIHEGDEWISPHRLAELPLAAPFRKAVEHLFLNS